MPPEASATSPDSTSVDPAKAVEIRKLLELTGSVKMARMMINQMVTTFRSQKNHVPPEFWDRLEADSNMQDLVNLLIPIYAKYYTLDDLKALNTFYQTPLGQKVLAATPQVMKESMQVGQAWGRALAAKVETELREEKEKDSEPASH